MKDFAGRILTGIKVKRGIEQIAQLDVMQMLQLFSATLLKSVPLKSRECGLDY